MLCNILKYFNVEILTSFYNKDTLIWTRINRSEIHIRILIQLDFNSYLL